MLVDGWRIADPIADPIRSHWRFRLLVNFELDSFEERSTESTKRREERRHTENSRAFIS